MRRTAWTLLAVGCLVGWLAMPMTAGADQPLPDQCDAGKCVDAPLDADGDCGESGATACTLRDANRMDCHAALPCADYLKSCQDESASDGCWLAHLIPRSAPVDEVDVRDVFKVRLEPGIYQWLMFQNPRAANVNMDFTLCVYAPGRPVQWAPVQFGTERVTVDTSGQSVPHDWIIVVKTGPVACPASSGSFAEVADDEPAPGGPAGARPWWNSLFPGSADACPKFNCRGEHHPNALCVTWKSPLA